MSLLMLKDLPRYECLLECAKRFPDLNPGASEVFMLMLQVADQLHSVKTDFLGRHGLSNGRFTVLMLLSTVGLQTCEDDAGNQRKGLTPAELAEMAGVTRATMSGLIDTLEKDGLVRREADPSDRRMMRVLLTARSDRFLDQVLPGYFRRVAAIMDPLASSDRQTLKTLLLKVQVGMAAAGQVDRARAAVV